MTNAAKVVLSAEDRSAAAFATFTRGLDEAGLSANAFKTNVAGLLAGISVGALATFTKNIINAVDALNDVADVTGSSVENISALEDVALRTGTNMDVVSSALVKFNATLKDADPSKGPGAVLKALNLDIEDLKRQDPAEALRQVAVALSGYADDGNKARAVQELFGRSVKEAAPFLKDLAENGQLNAKVTTAQAAEAEKFNKELFKLQTNANDAARAVVGSLVPAINRIFDDVRTLGDKATLAGLASSVTGLNRDLNLLKEKRGNPFFDQAAIEKQIGELTVKFDAAKKAFNDARGYRPAGGGRGFVNPPLVQPGLEIPEEVKDPKSPRPSTTTPRDPTADAKRYLENLQGQLQSAQALTATEKLLDDIRRGSLGKFTPELEKQLKATAAQVDATKAQVDATKALADAEKERAQNQKGLDDLVADIGRRDKERLDAMLGASDTGRLEKQRDDMLFLAEAYEQGRLGAVGSEEAMRKFSESAQAYLGTGGAVPQAMEEMAQSALQAAERIQGALGDELTNILSGEFDNIGNSFSKLIQRMLAEAAAAKIMDSLFGTVNAGTKQRSGGGLLDDAAKWLGNLIASANGNVFPAGPGISAYSSQVVSKPTIFPFAKGVGLMGEAGAEAIMPLRRDSAGRLGVSAAGASVTVNVINQSGQPVSAQQRSRSGANGEQIVDVVLTAIGESLANRSGPVARGLESGYGLRPAMA